MTASAARWPDGTAEGPIWSAGSMARMSTASVIATGEPSREARRPWVTPRTQNVCSAFSISACARFIADSGDWRPAIASLTLS
jgi:hypothetical protein